MVSAGMYIAGVFGIKLERALEEFETAVITGDDVGTTVDRARGYIAIRSVANKFIDTRNYDVRYRKALNLFDQVCEEVGM